MQKGKTIRLFALAAAAATIVLGGTFSLVGYAAPPPPDAHPAPPKNITCTGTVGGGSAVTSVSGNVTVPQGASCTLAFVNVAGNVQVQNGGSLLIAGYTEPSTISGNVQVNNCVSALLEGNVTVQGNVEISNCSGTTAHGFQGPGVVIGGNFQCQNNEGPCEAWLGQINGDAQIQNNRGLPSDVSLTAIGGNLQCHNNAVATTHKHGYNWVTKNVQGECATSFSTTSTSIGVPAGGGTSCAALASQPASALPVPNTVITSATDTPAAGGLPERCIVSGYVNQHVSPVDNCEYLDTFQVALPLPLAWNHRFFFQGGGGSEGSVPAPTGANSGSGNAASNFGITNGYVVATQDGGHENSLLKPASCGDGSGNTNEFYLDPASLIAKAYQSVQVTVLTAKYLTALYYGENAGHSYMLGCSDGGSRGMSMSHNFPQYFDGIVAGDPGYDIQSTEIGVGIWDEEQLLDVYNETLPALPPPTYVSEPVPEAAEPILYPGFPKSDQVLFETALLQTCDALDGVADGVIDNQPLCVQKFDPATATYVSAGVTYPLQCPGSKSATCLSPAQIQFVKAVNQGPRSSSGRMIYAPAGGVAEDHAPNNVPGFPYDGGFMSTTGIPSVAIGTATQPGASSHLSGVGYIGFSPPDPSYSTLTFDFNSMADLSLLSRSNPDITASTSLDISKFIDYGHKIIWYAGLSDPTVRATEGINYYNAMANLEGCDKGNGKPNDTPNGMPNDTPSLPCLTEAQKFSRLYTVPNMGHCDGGAATDEFDMITPLVQWVESGTAPGPVPATGVNFTATVYQVGFVSGAPDNAPSTRNRPLCAYPQEARFTGKTTMMNGVPVASNPADLAVASNYSCILPPAPYLQ